MVVGRQRAAGAIVFSIDGKRIKVLQLVQNNAFYGRDTREETIDIGPKGHVKLGESLVRAAHREMTEEIGLPLHMDTNFRAEMRYSFYKKDAKTGKKKMVNKVVTYFLAFVHQREQRQIVISEEHKKYYFAPIDEAIEKAQFPNQKAVLEAARTYITERYLT